MRKYHICVTIFFLSLLPEYRKDVGLRRFFPKNLLDSVKVRWKFLPQLNRRKSSLTRENQTNWLFPLLSVARQFHPTWVCSRGPLLRFFSKAKIWFVRPDPTLISRWITYKMLWYKRLKTSVCWSEFPTALYRPQAAPLQKDRPSASPKGLTNWRGCACPFCQLLHSIWQKMYSRLLLVLYIIIFTKKIYRT